ncbi:MAG: helix-turn-helix transcriptional regulator [Clostridiales bacterium]|nr:helix-turn-helix transcriptional regulator [Clostridiales bacterium]
MIFEKDDLHLHLLDVLAFDEQNVNMRLRSRSFCALSLRINGDTDIEGGGTTVHLSDHDLAFFPANFPYLRRSKRDKMIVFHIAVENCVAYELEVLRDFKFDTMLGLFTEAHREWSRKLPGYRYRAEALMYRVFAEIRTGLDDGSAKLSPIIADSLDYISANYTDPSLSVELLAERAHMSDTYFRRLFNGELGVNPKRYINDMRLEQAQSLLNAGYDTVAAVAEKVGFIDAKNFSTAFKKKFGYPPSKQVYTY